MPYNRGRKSPKRFNGIAAAECFPPGCKPPSWWSDRRVSMLASLQDTDARSCRKHFQCLQVAGVELAANNADDARHDHWRGIRCASDIHRSRCAKGRDGADPGPRREPDLCDPGKAREEFDSERARAARSFHAERA